MKKYQNMADNQVGINIEVIAQDNLNARMFKAINDKSLVDIRDSIALGANVNAVNKWGQTPFIIILDSTQHSINFKINIFNILIKNGADVNHATHNGYNTLLLKAVKNGEIKLISCLVKSGARLDIASHDLLLNSLRLSNLDVANLLILNGLDINSSNEGSQTALMILSWKGSLRDVKFLLDSGADHALKDRYGLDAYGLSKYSGDDPTISLIRSHTAKKEFDNLNNALTIEISGVEKNKIAPLKRRL